jgi:hypothetical protein
MGTEAEARALGAGESFEVNGEEYKLRPIVVRSLCEIERGALADYKRQYLKTFVDNADLLGENQATKVLQQRMEEAAGWDLQSLPQKVAYNAALLPVTEEATKWAEDFRREEMKSENQTRAVLAFALDNKILSEEKVKELCGKQPDKSSVRYDQWWVTASFVGMVSFVLASVRVEQPNVTRDQVESWSFVKIVEATRIVERITAASVGNL